MPGAPPLIGSTEWRARAAAAQQDALPRGDVIVSCTAPLGVGGLGRHLEEITEALARSGASATCICEPAPGSPPDAGARRRPHPARLLRPLGRVSPAWRLWRVSVEFDAAAAARVKRELGPGGHVIGFNGTSLDQLRAARAAGAESTGLASATAHVDRLVAQHALARRAYPLERSWATRVRARNLREYALADRIYASSAYVRDSFLAHGVPEERMAVFPLTPNPRFAPAAGSAASPASGAFEVVYIGGLTVDKGVPLLIDAVRALPHADLRLRLVGGWKTRGMRAFVQRAVAADPRIDVRPGDPLQALREAAVCVHAAYSDGFAYAPAEAMACGVPVIVSEDTGAKELIGARADGHVVPTGDLEALTDALDAAYRGELF